jgi:hypothetical protein
MEFFFPSADGQGQSDPEKAEELWQACRKGVETETGWEALSRRVFRLRYQHNGRVMEAKVGEREDYYGRERVMAIIAFPNCYKICCAVRGFLKIGDTPMVGLGSVLEVEDFDS